MGHAEVISMTYQRQNRKLYELLSERNAESSNMRHLDAEFEEEACIIKLVPSVPECVKRLSVDGSRGASVPLSFFYELIRNWKIAELFERHLFWDSRKNLYCFSIHSLC